jgi:hypothetical protein
MLAANVWHWWIGVALTIAIVLAVVALVGSYLKAVSAKKYPSGKRRRQQADL